MVKIPSRSLTKTKWCLNYASKGYLAVLCTTARKEAKNG